MPASLIYVADPMCSWCYGFAPELQQFVDEADVELELVMGGLWPGARAQSLDENLRTYLRETWTRVGDLTGQPFSFGQLNRVGWVYDTEPSCRAVVTMRAMVPGAEHRFFSLLQHAFYAEGRDIADEFTFPELLEAFPVDSADFMFTFRSVEMAEATEADFNRSRQLGALGFPTLLLESEGTYTPLGRGYTRAVHLSRLLEVLGSA